MRRSLIFQSSLLILVFVSFLLVGCGKPPNLMIKEYILKNYLTDRADVLLSSDKERLINELASIREDLKTDTFVVIVKALPDGVHVSEYTNKLFNYNNIGVNNNGKGLLILIAIDNKIMRIETSRELESIITDTIAHQAIQISFKSLRQKDYIGGINESLNFIKPILKKELF